MTMSTQPSTASFPTEERCITREWVQDILESYHRSIAPDKDPQIKVKHWDIKPSSKDREGFLSEQLAVGVTYSSAGEDEEKQAHFLAKLPPKDSFSKTFLKENLFDLREIKFYKEIKPALEEIERQYLTSDLAVATWAPDLYHAKHSEEEESIIVLADMCQRGYKVQDYTEGLTVSQTKAALTAIANVHSTALAMQMKEKINLQQQYPYLMSLDQAVESFNCLFDRYLPVLLKFLEQRNNHGALRDCLQRYSGKGKEILKQAVAPSEKLNTLIHCDLWCNNLLFKQEGDVTLCSIIDWQMVTFGRPALDVALLITTSMGPSERRKHEASLVSAYWDAFKSRLTEFGIQNDAINYTKEDLEGDYKLALAFSAIIVIGSMEIYIGYREREERIVLLLEDLMNDGVL